MRSQRLLLFHRILRSIYSWTLAFKFVVLISDTYKKVWFSTNFVIVISINNIHILYAVQCNWCAKREKHLLCALLLENAANIYALLAWILQLCFWLYC